MIVLFALKRVVFGVIVEPRELLGAKLDVEVDAVVQLAPGNFSAHNLMLKSMSSARWLQSYPIQGSFWRPIAETEAWAHMELTKLCFKSREFLGALVEGKVQAVVQVAPVHVESVLLAANDAIYYLGFLCILVLWQSG